MQHPRREQPVHAVRRKRIGRPVAARRQQVPGELERPSAPEPPVCPQREPEAVLGPELGAEESEGEICVRHECRDDAIPGLAVAGSVPIPLRHVRRVRGRQEDARAVREDRGGGQVGVQVLESPCVQVVLQLRVGARADEERMPGGEYFVHEAGLCDLGRPDRAADVVVALEHEHALAGLREQGGAGQRVDAAADDDHVVGPGHRPTSISRRSSGNEQSFSLPSTPMRKLSSTRRPPPPGQ